MGTKVKGLLKGLRYISQIFDEKEGDMEIGFPTDVKHVSHIGWDGPSSSAPSWMNEFKPSEDGSASEESKNKSSNPESEDNSVTEKRKPRSRRPSKGEDSSFGSSSRGAGDGQQKHRRRRSTNTPADSPKDESGSVRTRRLRNSTNSAEPPSNIDDQPAIPKHSRPRKPKGSGGSNKSKLKEGSPSTTDANNSTAEPAEEGSCSGSVQDKMNTANHLTSVLDAYEER